MAAAGSGGSPIAPKALKDNETHTRTLAVFAVALSSLTPACRRRESRSTFAGAPVIIISIDTMRAEAAYQI